ncbi:polysaccharide pyruvyl transferase family protein [Novosphingobium rosa]|uniref:polysaccharide pyruvyl transferase family protein n=1 Tax=Novosphingobium rosa TaxID=76978 RepID=UPI000829BE1C|nr:polysaccharide pyruvyl transferase family protein [Novosphingobium rosa]
MTSRPLTIALPWHSLGHGNLGVDALTRANIAIIQAAAARIGREVRITTLCSSGQVTPETTPAGVTVGPLPRIKPLLRGKSDYLAVLRRSDLVIDIGEGDSWSDIYGNHRYAFHAGTKVAALLLGKPLVLAPQTIGPFDNPKKRWLANRIMDRASAVFSRDNLSSQYLSRHKIKAKTAEFIDVAFRLPYDAQPRGVSPRPQVGINVSGLLYRDAIGPRSMGMTLDYAALTHRLIEALEQRGADVHLVPHVLEEGGLDDDHAFTPELTARFPQLKVPARFRSASEAKSYMSGLDFVVGGRMHACIGAFSSNTPVVPIAYSRKFNGLFGTLGYPHYVDGRAVDTNTALAAILTGFEQRAQLAEDIKPGLVLAKERLDAYESELAAIMAKL